MLSSFHSMAGTDFTVGAFALMVFVAGAAVAVLVVLGVIAIRQAGYIGTGQVLWRGALVVFGAALVLAIWDRSSVHEDLAAERRAIEQRLANVTARSIEPGSALACLDGVAIEAVESACEKALFASAEAVAAAVAYVDARISLLAASVRLAERDASYRPSLQRIRHAIETDRFGVVGHVLMARGCNGSDCAELKLLQDSRHILANMKTRAFEARVKVHAAGWHPVGAPIVAATPAPQTAPAFPTVLPLPQSGTRATITGTTPNAAKPDKPDFPSAASIPPVSIMNPEPEGPPAAAEQQAEPNATSPPKRATSKPPRRQSAREPAQRPAPPLSVVPDVALPASPPNAGSR